MYNPLAEVFMIYRCSNCKKEIENFSEKYVNYGVVEKKEECKECDYVDASNLILCLECSKERK
jgi:DNA-directed RNA polymerase subunit RPC12/RpoP